jgi:hypothetical protein
VKPENGTTTMPRSDEDQQGLRAALYAVAVCGALLTLASPFVLGRGGVVGVALGAAIATLNLWALGRIVRAFMNGAGASWAVLGALKLVGLVALLAVVLKLGLTSVIPLAIGYGALPVGIVFAQLGAARPRAATAPSVAGIDADSSPKGR